MLKKYKRKSYKSLTRKVTKARGIPTILTTNSRLKKKLLKNQRLKIFRKGYHNYK